MRGATSRTGAALAATGTATPGAVRSGPAAALAPATGTAVR
ncbi:hypothetical protein ACIGBL_12820 [Streptomyces sp. NPDC085614]